MHARIRSLLSVATALVVAATLSATPAQAAEHRSGPAEVHVSSRLLDRLEHDGSGRFVVEFAERAELGSASRLKDRAARGQAVTDALRSTAQASQAPAARLVRATPNARFQGFWLRNTAVVTGTADLARRIAELPGVTAVRAERTYDLVEPVAMEPAAGGETPWGIETIGAPAAWAEGVLGGGITIATIDSGVDYTHPALVDSYRGNLGAGGFDHDYAWWDPTGICGPTPCDNEGHGTHTTGTIVGGDGPGPEPQDVGVAPEAQWIAAKGCESDTCSESALLSSGQWILAPTRTDGTDPDPSRAPAVVNNSWSGAPGDPFYEDVVQAWRAAGIIPVFSAGNDGPGCNTVASPGDYPEVLTVGATDSGDGIADFSSRGPSVLGGTKPDLAAPGVGVVSSLPGGGYGSYSGTSMAAPHVAGTVALLLSAAPTGSLGFDRVRDLLTTSVVDVGDASCGTSPDGRADNVFGAGRLDAAAAVDLLAESGTLTGTVTGSDGPLTGASVTAEGERTYSATTDADGRFRIAAAAGTYTVTAESFGYAPGSRDGVEVDAGGTSQADLTLDPLPTAVLSGKVSRAENGRKFPGVTVSAVGTPTAPALTGSKGRYRLELPVGSYLVRFTSGGCTEPVYVAVDLLDDTRQNAAVARRLDAAGHGCRAIPLRWVDATGQTGLSGDDWSGRLRLPFDFPFYEASYNSVFLNPNGFVNFLEADPYSSNPEPIPDADRPNAAIYPLWQNMYVGDAGSVEYATVGRAPHRAFVIEYENIAINDIPGFIDLELKLWEDGRIDLLYGDSAPGLASGSTAVIGIENAAGDDALQLAAFEPLIDAGTAYRIRTMRTGVVTGTVTAANDGLPVPGARVTAAPGGIDAVADEQGRYALQLLPGTYELIASASGYGEATTSVSVTRDAEVTADFSLASAQVSTEPGWFDLATPLGVPVTDTLEVANTGTGPLTFEIRESDGSVTLPELPPAGSARMTDRWGPSATDQAGEDAGGSAARQAPLIRAAAVPDPGLLPVVDDPIGDAQGTVEVAAVRGAGNAEAVTVAVDLTSPEMAQTANGFVYLDLDQDPSTGFPPSVHNGLPTQDVGFDVYVELWHYGPGDFRATLINPFSGDSYRIPGRVDGSSIVFVAPLSVLGDDGWLDLDLVMGDDFGPSDWAPDGGHGTVETYADAPWLQVEPTQATVAPGESVELAVSVGGAEVLAGDYQADIVLLTDDPGRPRVHVPVSLQVQLPDDFGRVEGAVSDAHTGEPVEAEITVLAERAGAPYPVSATADADGHYVLYAPQGTWPIRARANGYVPKRRPVQVTAGHTADGIDFLVHKRQPHATVSGGPLDVQLPVGSNRTLSIDVGNLEGHAPLGVEIRERPMPYTSPPEDTAADHGSARQAPDGWSPTAARTQLDGGTALVVMDELPWDSDALLQALAANAVTYDVATAASLSAVELGGYQLVIVASDQPQTFYDTLTSQLPRLEDWVGRGGFLWFSAAAWGFAGGSTDGLRLPGGATVQGPEFEFYNVVTDPAHPIVQGIPSPAPGDFASSASFDGLPDGTDVIMRGQSSTRPTLVEYTYGAGRVLATTQPLEYAKTYGWELGLLIDNGVPYAAGFEAFGDLPWLSVQPTQATVPAGESARLEVGIDTTGIEPGRYRGDIVVLTDDPEHPALSVPVNLVVPAYERSVNVGGRRSVSSDGAVFVRDRAFKPGRFGFVGKRTETVTTQAPIDGTNEDGRFQDARTGMRAYRFSVPDGTYRVRLEFAEIQFARKYQRLFSAYLEGERVISNLDLIDDAGPDTAYVRTYEAQVEDGRLDVDFDAVRGDRPILNAISVTHVPD